MRKQLAFNLNKGKHGGCRAGAGRPRLHSKGVAHRIREEVTHRTPMHINFKFKTFIKNKTCLKILKKALINSRAKGLRILHFSLQSNHIHLIVEAEDNITLSKGMRSLTVTFAKGVMKGSIQVERYHLHVLRTLRETKNAIRYVIFNEQNHSQKRTSWVDEFSSLLLLKEANQIIKRYAKEFSVTLKVGSCEKFVMDAGQSFLAGKAQDQLIC